MTTFFRRPNVISDARPPRLPQPGADGGLGLCAQCGLPVAANDGLDQADGVEHFVCDSAIRSEVGRRVEAVRALHRALPALRPVPDAHRRIRAEIDALPDVASVHDVLAALERTRTAIECQRGLDASRRRLSLSYLDAILRKLAA